MVATSCAMGRVMESATTTLTAPVAASSTMKSARTLQNSRFASLATARTSAMKSPVSRSSSVLSTSMYRCDVSDHCTGVMPFNDFVNGAS